MPGETFEHQADIGIRGLGATLEEAFAEAARAMFSVMYDLEHVKPQHRAEVRCTAPDVELLFVEWLNTLLSTADLEGMVPAEFDLEIRGDSLKGVMYGEPFSPEKHRPKTEVKAATYSCLRVGRLEDSEMFIAQCVIDV